MASRLYRKFLALLFLLITPAGLWVAAQTPAHVVIMHTNDMHGQLLPRNGVGGIAEIATIMRRAKPDLILDAGDIFTGTFLSDEFLGLPAIQAMNKIRYVSGTIGNHEFDYGQNALRMRLREAKFPVLSANLQTPISEIKKYTTVTVQGIRFGIIGLTTADVKVQTHPKNLGGVTVKDPLKTFEEILPEVRKKSDFIVATVHLDDAEEKRLASAFPEIRLIIGGHNHSALGPIWLDHTLVAKTGSSARNVGRVDLDFVAKKLTRMEAQLIPVTNVAADPEIASILKPFEARVAAKMAVIVGEATDPISRSGDEESPLADLIADAFREKGKTQVALQNTGGIRSAIGKGQITWGSVFEVLPFQNTLVTLKVTGAQLKKTLLNSTVGLMAVSGLRVRFDRGKSGDDRLVSLTLSDGAHIEDGKLYSVTTNDFVVAGGDGYTELGKGTDIHDTGILLREVLVDYIKAHRIVSPAIDGRITFN